VDESKNKQFFRGEGVAVLLYRLWMPGRQWRAWSSRYISVSLNFSDARLQRRRRCANPLQA